ncbi:MAG: phosphatidate cytidylyltransferase [Magnetococcales bacterium]|nr:phosphatidate cytidylyltransferase [Magnetococcales bacterium]MBF0322018.1 phosphatidate cytidylyltransferase [Magnetococcales bacterium]
MLAPLTLALLFFGTSQQLCVVVSLIVAGLLYEWHRFRPPLVRVDLALSICLGWLLVISHCMGRADWLPALLTGGLAIFLGVATWRFSPENRVLDRTGFLVFGQIYCTMPLVLFLQIHAMPHGPSLLGMLLLIVWGTDIGAYFAGRAFGKKKLAPQLSPGKTWAGFYGGLAFGTLAGWLAATLLLATYKPWHILLLGLILSLVGQWGDLAESMVKRESNVKDSGSLIPGHGGLLDRLDSLLLATPVLNLCLFGVDLIGN